MSASPTRSASRSPAPSPRRRSSAASPRRRSTSPITGKFESDDEWATVKKPEPPRPPRRGCAFIQSERGCRKGNACTFSHDPADLADPRWHQCAEPGCTNLCRGVYCPRCRSKHAPREVVPRRERSRSPKAARSDRSERRRSRSRTRHVSRDRSRDRSRERSREKKRERVRETSGNRSKPAFCSQCGRRY